MAEPTGLVPGAVAAKALDIYLGQLYGWVKAGKLTNHKKDGKYVVPDGKGLIVDLEAARAVWMTTKKKGGAAGAKRTKARASTRSADGEVVATPKLRKAKVGQILSFDNGQNGSVRQAHRPAYTLAQVVGSGKRLTYLDEGDKRVSYSGTVIDNIVFANDRLSTMMARGIVHIERPTRVLGMVLLAFITEGKLDEAESLEKWMIKNDIPVVIPEPMELEDDDDEDIVRGQPILTLAGDEDE